MQNAVPPAPTSESSPFGPSSTQPHSPPRPGQRHELPLAPASLDALQIAELARTGRLLAVISASPLEAQRLAEEIAWFAPTLRVHLLPDWETLPYDTFSPHQDLISERLATLHAVAQGDCDVLIVAATTAVTRLPPAGFLAAHTFMMKKGERLVLDKTTRKLKWMKDGVVISTYDVRFGSEYTPTREGLFSVFMKSRDHVSTIYNTPMP